MSVTFKNVCNIKTSVVYGENGGVGKKNNNNKNKTSVARKTHLAQFWWKVSCGSGE